MQSAKITASVYFCQLSYQGQVRASRGNPRNSRNPRNQRNGLLSLLPSSLDSFLLIPSYSIHSSKSSHSPSPSLRQRSRAGCPHSDRPPPGPPQPFPRHRPVRPFPSPRFEPAYTLRPRICPGASLRPARHRRLRRNRPSPVRARLKACPRSPAWTTNHFFLRKPRRSFHARVLLSPRISFPRRGLSSF